MIFVTNFFLKNFTEQFTFLFWWMHRKDTQLPLPNILRHDIAIPQAKNKTRRIGCAVGRRSAPNPEKNAERIASEKRFPGSRSSPPSMWVQRKFFAFASCKFLVAKINRPPDSHRRKIRSAVLSTLCRSPLQRQFSPSSVIASQQNSKQSRFPVPCVPKSTKPWEKGISGIGIPPLTFSPSLPKSLPSPS